MSFPTADVRWQPPARETRHPARATSDEPDAGRAEAQAIGRRSGIGMGQTKDGAGGGPAEERAYARGRGMRLLKIEEARTRMRVRDDGFE